MRISIVYIVLALHLFIVPVSLAAPLTLNAEKKASKNVAFKKISDIEKMMVLAGGCFQMGSETEFHFVHEVCVDKFFISKYEVTQGLYEKITGISIEEQQNKAPEKIEVPKGESYPMVFVSWEDAQSFIRQLNIITGKKFRLPTEAEWEYAARSGGRDEEFAGGNDPDAVAWYGENSGRTLHLVGQKQANGLGLFDMSGNVNEWCSDWYDGNYYEVSPRNNPSGPTTGKKRVYRGGPLGRSASFVRAALRYSGESGMRTDFIGFRLALSQDNK